MNPGARLARRQHQGRIQCDRPRHRDTLLLSPTQITGPVVEPILQADTRQ